MHIGSPWAEILIVSTAFLVGAIPFGWLLARLLKGVDLRTVGSGGTGATNASRLWQGPQAVAAFVVVFVLDFGKGLFGALVSLDMAEWVGNAAGSTSSALTLQVACGMAAVLGHMFTPYLRFRGGKGVATAFGVVAALAPLSALWGVGVCALLVGVTKYVSLGSLGAMVVIPLTYWLDWGSEAFRSRLAVTAFLVLSALAVFWRHRTNIRRILRGTERRLGEADKAL